jgi:hypothetical protein
VSAYVDIKDPAIFSLHGNIDGQRYLSLSLSIELQGYVRIFLFRVDVICPHIQQLVIAVAEHPAYRTVGTDQSFCYSIGNQNTILGTLENQT